MSHDTRVYIQAEGFKLCCPNCNEVFDVIEIGFVSDGPIELECFECLESAVLNISIDK